MKWKVFDRKSWAALLSSLARIKETADNSASAVSEVGADLAEFAELMTAGLAGKQEKEKRIPFSIPATGWQKDEEDADDWPYFLDIPVEGLTTQDVAKIYVSRESAAAARSCGICQVTQTLNPADDTGIGRIRLWTHTIPETGISAEYQIEKCKE